MKIWISEVDIIYRIRKCLFMIVLYFELDEFCFVLVSKRKIEVSENAGNYPGKKRKWLPLNLKSTINLIKNKLIVVNILLFPAHNKFIEETMFLSGT